MRDGIISWEGGSRRVGIVTEEPPLFATLCTKRWIPELVLTRSRLPLAVERLFGKLYKYWGDEPLDTTLQSIIEIALQQGIWAALYIYRHRPSPVWRPALATLADCKQSSALVARARPRFFRMLKENAERETQYQQMINHLSTNVVEGIADINDKLDDMARKMYAWLLQSDSV